MTAFRLGHCGLSVTATIAMLVGCGGGRQIPATGASAGQLRTSGNATATRAGGPLLYVARVHDGVSIVSLNDDEQIAQITGYGYVPGLCSDPSGNIWMPNFRHGRYYVDEFAHGGTKAIAELRVPKESRLASCAVDPSSGDLVVLGSNIDGYWSALIWRGARAGKPEKYGMDFDPLFAAYDNAGNLFITGWAGGSDWFFEMGELAKGSAKVTRIRLDKHALEPGEVQWDGTNVVVATSVSRRARNPFSSKSLFRLYRLQISGTSGHVVQIIQPQRLREGDFTGVLFVLHAQTVIGVANKGRKSLLEWTYPDAGKATKTIGRYDDIHGLAISK